VQEVMARRPSSHPCVLFAVVVIIINQLSEEIASHSLRSP
jgi:hypothetical protein